MISQIMGIDPMLGLSTFTFIILVIIVIVIGLIINSIFLKIALTLVDSRHTDFGDVFVTSIICVLFGWIPCLGCLLCGAVIGSRHDTGFFVGIVVYILAILIGYILTFIISLTIVSAIFGVSATIPALGSYGL
ncbi:MAG: hypothetical protein R6U96_15000 [Promethearchaeia archaeon]